MKLLRGVYEGPSSHGILRVASSMTGTHAILRTTPEENSFPTLYAAWGRTGTPPPVTWSAREEPLSPAALAGIARRHPEVEAILFARSEAVSLSEEHEAPPELSPDSETDHQPSVIACDWATLNIRDFEAADLTLEALVANRLEDSEKGQERSAVPSVNLFGAPIFGSGAADYDEVERLLSAIGVEVNARVPLGASVGDLSILPHAWANVVLYRETSESATLYLQDEFGMPRVTTPLIGSAGTGAALRSVGELCGLEPSRVRRATWSELGLTARLPWYARLASSETFRGMRAAIFGDFTHPLGLGFALAREVGLEVGPCGTYLTHMDRDFLFQAQTFTDEAFVSDDPDEVAHRVEEAGVDLLIGTSLERPLAEALDIPFLPLCPPFEEHPFARPPILGYQGSNHLADALDNALRYPRGRPEEPPGLPWTDAALEDLEEIPAFLRGRARRQAEEHARELLARSVTRDILQESRL